MITHIVCWKYKSGTMPETRAEHIAALKKLPELITDIKSFSVGQDIMRLDRSYDTGLVATYETRSDLDHYNNHPEHQSVAAMGKEIAEQVVSVDFIS